MGHLKLSAEIIALRLGDYVKKFRNDSENPMSIETFSIFRESGFMLRDNCLYLCANSEVPPRKHVQPGTCIIFCNCDVDIEEYSGCGCGLIVVDEIDEFSLINIIAAVFRLYDDLRLEIETVAEGPEAFRRLVQIGERLFGCPVCIMDNYQDIVARSTWGYDFLNPLWDSVSKDNKTHRCEILYLYEDKFTRPPVFTGDKEGPAIAAINGFAVASHSIRNKGALVGSVWAFKTKVGAKFSVAELQLFDWFATKLDHWFSRLGVVAEGSGTHLERYLKDVLNGEFRDELYAREAAVSAGSRICSKSEYQMFVMRPKTGVLMASNLALNEHLLSEFPDGLTCVDGFTSVLLLPAEGSEYPSKRTVDILEKTCRENQYYGLLGTPFKKLLDAPNVYRQLIDCYSFIDTVKGEPKLYHFCEYVVQQNMKLIMDNEPVETLIHPQIRKLLAYDEANNTDYLETLKVYLNNKASITSAAKQLHMHRNTLQNRINRIGEILDDDFSNWETRRLLLYSIDFLHFVKHGNI